VKGSLQVYRELGQEFNLKISFVVSGTLFEIRTIKSSECNFPNAKKHNNHIAQLLLIGELLSVNILAIEHLFIFISD
jgi:hypothetical protein